MGYINETGENRRHYADHKDDRLRAKVVCDSQNEHFQFEEKVLRGLQTGLRCSLN